MLHTHRSFRLLLPLLIALPTLGNAAILRVGTGCTYATPQAALAVAVNGDTLRIRSGAYPGPLDIHKALQVEGGYDDCTTTARTGRSDIYGNAPATSASSLLTVTLPGQTHLLLDRITLRDNIKDSGDGGAIYALSALRLNAVEIRNNRTNNGNGGGIYLKNASVELVEDGTVLFEANQANAGGAIAADGNLARVLFDLGAVGAAATLRNNKVNTGSMSGSSDIYLYNGAGAALVDTMIEHSDNNTPHDPITAAIKIDASAAPSRLLMQGCQLINSIPSQRYMAIWAFGSDAQIELRNSLIDGWSTGLVLRDGSALLRGVQFRNNTTNSDGAGVRLLGNAQFEGHSLEFTDNVAENGGAMAVFENASWSLFGAPGAPTRFVGNRAVDATGRGGAIYHNSDGTGSINDSDLEWGTVEFLHNRAELWNVPGPQGRGGAIAIDSPARAQFNFRSPLLFTGNHAGLDGGAISVERGHLQLSARAGEEIAFEGNSAVNGDGGAINRQGQNSLQINWGAGSHGAVRFITNYAMSDSGLGRGGSIASLGGGSLRLQAPIEFRGGRARYGGQIAVLAFPPDVGELVMQGWQNNTRGIVVAGGVVDNQGGGIYLAGGGVDATLDWVQIGMAGEPNRVFSGPGENIAVMQHANLLLRNTAIGYADNSPWAPVRGSALFADLGTTVLMESVFGTAGTPPAPGAAWPCEPATLPHNRHCSEILENQAPIVFNGLGGGSVHADSGSQVTLRDVSMERNPGDPGAIFVAAGAVVTASDVRMIGHANTIEVAAGGEFTGEHLTLADNTGTALNVADGANVALFRSIVWNNQAGIMLNGAASINSGCNISQAGIHGDNMDPMFVVSNRGSHRLGMGSPALDQCFTDPIGNPRDLDGATRQQGSNSDIGAYEGAYSAESLFGNGFE